MSCRYKDQNKVMESKKTTIVLIFGSEQALDGARAKKLESDFKSAGVEVIFGSNPIRLRKEPKIQQIDWAVLVAGKTPPLGSTWQNFFHEIKKRPKFAALSETNLPATFIKDFSPDPVIIGPQSLSILIDRVVGKKAALSEIDETLVLKEDESQSLPASTSHWNDGELKLSLPAIDASNAADVDLSAAFDNPVEKFEIPKIQEFKIESSSNEQSLSEDWDAVKPVEPDSASVAISAVETPLGEPEASGASFSLDDKTNVSNVMEQAPVEESAKPAGTRMKIASFFKKIGGEKEEAAPPPPVKTSTTDSISLPQDFGGSSADFSASRMKKPEESISFDVDSVPQDSSVPQDERHVLQRYGKLKEREAREKEVAAQVLRRQIQQLEERLTRSENERRRIVLQLEESDAKNRALKDGRDQEKHHLGKLEGQHQEELRALQLRLDNAQFQATKAEKKLEEFRERVRSDIQRIRMRERELANRLELQKRDAEALLSTKDERLMSQKREIDRLEFEIESLKERFIDETQKAEDRAAKLTRAMQSLRLATGMLSGMEEEVLPGARSSDSNDDGEAA